MSKERRSYPRYPVEFPIKVTVAEDAEGNKAKSFPAAASNLSRTSIQFSCDAELVTVLLRQPQLPHTCLLDFKLPWHNRQFKVQAQVLTHRRISQRQYVLALLLRHDNETQEDLLDSLLDNPQKTDEVS